jgi:ferredoxin
MTKKRTAKKDPSEKKKIVVEVNRGTCIGCGNCASICPLVFELDEEGISTVNEEEVNEKNLPDILEARDACSTGAITVESDEED